MLTLYRRHLAKCDHAKSGKKRGTVADEKTSCKCPIWIQGTPDGKARNLNRSTFGKYNRLAKALKQFADDHSYRLLTELSTDVLRKFRETWTLAPRTAGKQLEHLRQIFRFAVESGWLTVNPAKAIKVP